MLVKKVDNMDDTDQQVQDMSFHNENDSEDNKLLKWVTHP
jgi:hypothetical protein